MRSTEAKARQAQLIQTLLFQVKALGLPEPILEYKFHPERFWRFDLVWVGVKVALEVEGGQWIGGRHVSGTGFDADVEKYAEALVLSWRVLRVTPKQVESGQAATWLERLLNVRR